MTPKENRIKKPHDHLGGHRKAFDKIAFVNSKREKMHLRNWLEMRTWLTGEGWLWSNGCHHNRQHERLGKIERGSRGNNLHVDGRPYT